MRESLGYDEVFDDLFYSCELGVAKPDPAYFTEAVSPPRHRARHPAARRQRRQRGGGEGAGLVAELFASDGGRTELDRILGSCRK